MANLLNRVFDHWRGLLWTFLVGGVIWFVGHALNSALNLAEVRVSMETQKCVAVELPDGKAGDCAKLPKQYNRVWVP